MLHGLWLAGCLLIAQVEAPPRDGLPATVERLVRQLDAPRLEQRETAEWELMRLGPGVLDLLPQATDSTPAEVRQRVGRIRQQLERALAESIAQPSLVTLHGKDMPLSKVLAAMSEQTGNKIVDAREEAGQPASQPTLDVDFEKTLFWRALDGVTDRAGLAVYPFGEARAVRVIARPEGQLPGGATASVSGPFRFDPVAITARRDLRNPASSALLLQLVVAWEPRLAPITLRQSFSDVKAVDEEGRPLELDQSQAELEAPVDPSAIAVELTLPFQLPPRDVRTIARLQGTLEALLPGKIETFRFDKLLEASGVPKRIAGTTVTLERVRKNGTIWEAAVRVQFDQAAGALESHRAWILNNEAYLEGPDGRKIANDGFETTRRTEDEIGLVYLFDLEGPPEKLAFVYKAPGLILTTKFPYELKNLKLP